MPEAIQCDSRSGATRATPKEAARSPFKEIRGIAIRWPSRLGHELALAICDTRNSLGLNLYRLWCRNDGRRIWRASVARWPGLEFRPEMERLKSASRRAYHAIATSFTLSEAAIPKTLPTVTLQPWPSISRRQLMREREIEERHECLL